MRNAVSYLVVLLLFGMAVPAAKGLGFFDPVLLAAYACLGMIFAGPAAAQAFEKRPASLAQAVQWIAKAAAFGELLAIAMVACGIGTVYVTHRGYVFPPDLESLAFAVLLGLAGSLTVASLAGWVTVQVSSQASRMALRVVFVGLVALFYFKGRWLPSIVEMGTVLCLLATGVFVLLLRLRLARAAEAIQP